MYSTFLISHMKFDTYLLFFFILLWGSISHSYLTLLFRIYKSTIITKSIIQLRVFEFDRYRDKWEKESIKRDTTETCFFT